jgi:hypothetical protein
MKLATHRQGQHDVTDSSWVPAGLHSGGHSPFPQNGASGKYKCSDNKKIFKLILCIGDHEFDLSRFAEFNFCLLFCLSIRSVCTSALSKFVMYILLLSPLTNPDLSYSYSCTYTDIGCPVIEVSSF